MRIVNISLVGGQTMPVYVGIKATMPERVVLVHSDTTKKDAQTIKKNNDMETVLTEMHPVDFARILSATDSLLDKYADWKVYVNISSGTKPWSIAFYKLSLNRENVTVVYVDQNNVFYDLTHGTQKNLNLQLGIEEILRFHHQKVSLYKKLCDYNIQDQQQMLHARQLRTVNTRDFNELTISTKNKEWVRKIQNNKTGELILKDTSYATFDKNTHSVEIGLMKKGSMKTHSFNSPHVMDVVFFAGWFEYEVAMLLGRWKQATEVWMGARFPYIEGKDKNEIDVLVSLGSKLLFVECKTQIADNTNIDKFKTAADLYGGRGCMKLFVTDSKMTDLAKEKCRDHGILSFSFEEALPLEEQIKLGNRSYVWNRLAKLLHAYLDKELKTINK